MVENNPFRAPEADLAVEPQALGNGPGGYANLGEFSVGSAISKTIEIGFGNLGMIVGGTLLAALLSVVSYITIIGILFLVPAIYWGWNKLMLNVCRNQAQTKDLFSAFERYGKRNFGFLLLLIIVVLPSAPFGVLEYYFKPEGAITSPYPISLIGTLLMAPLYARLAVTSFIYVDQDVSTMKTIRLSWRATEPHWGG